MYLIFSFYAPKDIVHPYGPYDSRAEAVTAMQEMLDDEIKRHGEFEVKRTTKFWVRKLIDVREIDAKNKARDSKE